MINKLKSFFNKLLGKKGTSVVTHKEIKSMYRNFSKNDLIRALIKLANENAALKLKLKGIKL